MLVVNVLDVIVYTIGINITNAHKVIDASIIVCLFFSVSFFVVVVATIYHQGSQGYIDERNLLSSFFFCLFIDICIPTKAHKAIDKNSSFFFLFRFVFFFLRYISPRQN